MNKDSHHRGKNHDRQKWAKKKTPSFSQREAYRFERDKSGGGHIG